MKSLTAVWKSWHSLPLFSPTHTYIVFCFLCVLWVWQKLYGYVHKEMPSIKRDYEIWYYVLSHCIMYALWISPWWNVILMSSLVFKLVGYMLLLIFFFWYNGLYSPELENKTNKQKKTHKLWILHLWYMSSLFCSDRANFSVQEHVSVLSDFSHSLYYTVFLCPYVFLN